MKKRLLTKSDVKNQMVKLFSSTLPELKNIGSFPIIACEYGESLTGLKVAKKPYWIWILPNGSAIVYKIFANSYTYIPKLSTNVTVALDGTLIDNEDYDIEIKKLTYRNDTQKITDVVVVIEETPQTPSYLGKPYEVVVSV